MNDQRVFSLVNLLKKARKPFLINNNPTYQTYNNEKKKNSFSPRTACLNFIEMFKNSPNIH